MSPNHVSKGSGLDIGYVLAKEQELEGGVVSISASLVNNGIKMV